MGVRAQRNASVVQAILAGEQFDAKQLGYDLDGVHLGVIAVGPSAKAVVERLRAALARPVLPVTRDGETTSAWFGGHRAPSASELKGLARAAKLRDSTVLAMGEPASGIKGFCQTHRQAQDALLVARRAAAPSVMRYADVALIAPFLEDEARARWLIEIYATPLDDGRDSAALRETARAYYAAGGNVRAAAATLGVHRTTVQRRVDEIDRLLDWPVSTRQAEIEIALRLEELLRRA